MSKQRSRRLRKKLHLGEFQEFGFAFKNQIKPGAREEIFIDALLDEVIEPRGLEFGGWVTVGFITKAARGSVSEEDRAAVMAWLRARPEVESALASELVDAWYTDFLTEGEMTKFIG